MGDSSTDELIQQLIQEAQHIEEDADTSSKGHFESERLWGNVNTGIGIPLVALAAAASSSAFADKVGLAAILSAVVAGLGALLTFLSPAEQKALHHRAGSRFLALRDDARVFWRIDAQYTSDRTKLLSDLKELIKRKVELNAESPAILRFARRGTRRGIEMGESGRSVDK